MLIIFHRALALTHRGRSGGCHDADGCAMYWLYCFFKEGGDYYDTDLCVHTSSVPHRSAMLGYLSSCRQYVARRFVHVGCTAAASDLAEQMVQYVRSSCAVRHVSLCHTVVHHHCVVQDNPQQALDVLQSGLTAVGGDQDQRARSVGVAAAVLD